ncbi:MAG: hypothetical protein SFY70_04900, partial [Bacteroidia bacterium]|nr:hypothetical protein [Bacteroidia bacterium]
GWSRSFGAGRWGYTYNWRTEQYIDNFTGDAVDFGQVMGYLHATGGVAGVYSFVGMVFTPENQLDYIPGSATVVQANDNATITAYFLVPYGIAKNYDKLSFSDKTTENKVLQSLQYMTQNNFTDILNSIAQMLSDLGNSKNYDKIYINGIAGPGRSSTSFSTMSANRLILINWYFDHGAQNSNPQSKAYMNKLSPLGILVHEFGHVIDGLKFGSTSDAALRNTLKSKGIDFEQTAIDLENRYWQYSNPTMPNGSFRDVADYRSSRLFRYPLPPNSNPWDF